MSEDYKLNFGDIIYYQSTYRSRPPAIFDSRWPYSRDKSTHNNETCRTVIKETNDSIWVKNPWHVDGDYSPVDLELKKDEIIILRIEQVK